MLQACHASRFGLHCLSRCSILKLREDVNIAPAYPTQRAFVVQSHAETDVAQRFVARHAPPLRSRPTDWLAAQGKSRRGGGSGVIEASIFALLGLLVAFTFSGAEARFDTRRQLIVEETNAIGTAYLRLDLLPADAQPDVAGAFSAVPGGTAGSVSQAPGRCRSARGPGAVSAIAGGDLNPGRRRVSSAGGAS